MTDRNKRVEKIFKKMGIKGWLNPVDSLENSQFVLVEDKRCFRDNFIIKTEDYKTSLERGETFPPDSVYFLVNRDKTNNKCLLKPTLMWFYRA